MRKWMTWEMDKNFSVAYFKHVPRRITSPVRYYFKIIPKVPHGKKYKLYSAVSFPGIAHAVFQEVL